MNQHAIDFAKVIIDNLAVAFGSEAVVPARVAGQALSHQIASGALKDTPTDECMEVAHALTVFFHNKQPDLNMIHIKAEVIDGMAEHGIYNKRVEETILRYNFLD